MRRKWTQNACAGLGVCQSHWEFQRHHKPLDFYLDQSGWAEQGKPCLVLCPRVIRTTNEGRREIIWRCASRRQLSSTYRSSRLVILNHSRRGCLKRSGLLGQPHRNQKREALMTLPGLAIRISGWACLRSVHFHYILKNRPPVDCLK
jgi:hypothetical protein